MYARPRPRLGVFSTRAPAASAISARLVGRAVDDEDLADHAGAAHPLLAPVDELGDRELLVQRGHDDRELGVLDVVCGDEKLELRVDDRRHPGDPRKGGAHR